MNRIFGNNPVAKNTDTQSNWFFVRIFIALVLLVAAGLKGYSLSVSPLLGDGIFYLRWFNIFVVEFELFFGLWLVFGFLPKLTRLAAVGCFTVFALVSLYKALSGATSCGCFSEFVPVNPWIMTVFDCGVVFVLLRFCSCTNSFGKIDRFLIVNFVVSWLLVALPFGWLMVSFQPSRITSNGEIIGTSNTMMLYPKEWLGLQLPILPFVEIDDDLKQGHWIIVFYGAECKKCKEYFAEWQQSGFPVDADGDKRIAMLEISGQPENDFRQTMKNKSYYWGILNRSKQWFVETPSVLLLEEGIVKQVWSEKETNFSPPD